MKEASKVADRFMAKSTRWIMFVVLALCVVSANGKATQFDDHYRRWQKMTGRQLYMQGIDYLEHKNQPDSALLCFTFLTAEYNKGDNKQIKLRESIGAMNTAGQIYMDYYYDFNKAYNLFLQAQELAEKSGDKDILCFNYLNLANLNMLRQQLLEDDGDMQAVFDNYKKAFHLSVETKTWNALTSVLTNLVYQAFTSERLQTVANEIVTFNSLNLPDTIRLKSFVQTMCYGVTFFMRKDYEKALAAFDKLQTVVDENTYESNRVRLTMIAHNMKYASLKYMGRRIEALKELRIYEQKAIELNSSGTLLDIYRYYHDYYTEEKNQMLAEKYELLYLRQKDFIINKSQVRALNDTKFLMELGKLDEQVRDLSYQRSMQMWAIIVVGLFLVFMGVAFAMLYRKYKQVREKNEQLYVKDMQLLDSEAEKKELIISYSNQNDSSATERQKYQNSSLSDEEKTNLLHRVYMVMETNDEIYLESFNQKRLAEILDVSYVHLSQVINEKYGQNFYAMLNEYRIKEACRRMNNTGQYGQYTIEALAMSVGFKSRSNFTHNFKQATGMTPSEYLKLAKN